MAETSTANLFSGGSRAPQGDAIYETGESNVRRVGVSNFRRNRARLFPGMDTKRALVRPVPVYVTADSVMSEDEAGATTVMLLNRCGLSTEDDSIMVGFVKAACLCMAINSSSVLVPGRAKMYVAGSEFHFFADVMVPLGNDARRYFRAYANVTRDYLKEVIEKARRGPASDSAEDVREYENVLAMYDAIVRVAENRGLMRCMDMIHDSAEFCTDKTQVERTFLAQSKATIFATGAYLTNAVDNPVVNGARSSKPVGAVVNTNGHAGMSGMPEGY